jgi:hypothetical protein
MFSRISAALSRRSATTIPALHTVIHNAFTPEPITADLNNLLDIKSWLSPHIKGLKNHSRPHAFRFVKGKDGNMEMTYRNWSTSGKKVWMPKKAPLMILKKEPKGTPPVLQPEYRKCPTVADLTRGLEQTKARFRPDEVDWWNKYIEQEEVERERWVTLSKEGKRYVSDCPVISHKYVEVKEVQEDDEESKKHIGEIEKLLEKTNKFPEVSILDDITKFECLR